jgi:hypothetical protein
VYTSGTNGLVLDKTLTVKGQNLFAGFGVWGNYVAIPGIDSSSHQDIELWDGSTGTKLDAVSMTVDFGNGNGKVYSGLLHPSISKGGYMAVSTSAGTDNAVYLYKLNVPPPVDSAAGTCTAGSFQIGATGTGVRALQIQLNTFGANLTVDGVYGPLTQAAVNKYCVANNNNNNNNNNAAAQQPVIITLSTTTPFAQTRTYTWSTTAPDKGDILWGVNWGDGTSETFPVGTTCPAIPPKGTGKNWTYTVSHTWHNPGNYTIKVFANDCRNPVTVTPVDVTI